MTTSKVEMTNRRTEGGHLLVVYHLLFHTQGLLSDLSDNLWRMQAYTPQR
jgi:hypothetical protein